MRAAVITTFDHDPVASHWPDPQATTPDELVVDVLAAAISPLVRARANGSHYSYAGHLPLVPGVDGVGRDADGTLRYFMLGNNPLGTIAEKTVIDRRQSVVLPDDADPVAVAAGANPAMSSWLALRQRSFFEPGQSILIIGATGVAGGMATQVARRFGAARIVVAGRNTDRLAELIADGHADAFVPITDDHPGTAGALADGAVDVDVVLDYIWGPLAAAAIPTLVARRPDAGRPLTWIEVGAAGGPTAAIPGHAFRAARLTLVGSGIGSVSGADMIAELHDITHAIADGSLQVDARAVALADIETAWADSTSGTARTVIVP